MKRLLLEITGVLLLTGVVAGVARGGSPAEVRTWSCEILPSEARHLTDPVSGAKVVFVTTNPARDVNLYFHQRSWLSDGSLLLFFSDRTGKSELFGYLEATGELVRLTPPDSPSPAAVTAARQGNRIYLTRGKQILAWDVTVHLKPSSEVRVAERVLATLDRTPSELTESCDGRFLATQVGRADKSPGREVLLVDTRTGAVSSAFQVPYNISHLQFSRAQPDLIMYAHNYGTDYAPTDSGAERHCRMWLANVRTHVTWPLHWQAPGELNTHECWWVGDQITFCGGYKKGWSPVRVLDLHTGLIRVIGEGAYWENATPAELAKVNWWHASGDYQGRWVAADNWHGIIALFDARTAQRRILTVGHRTYGHGVHPHVGWNHLGGEVVFASNRFGNPDVCVAYIPKDWR